MTSEIGEMYNAMRKASKVKKQSNLEYSTEKLKHLKIFFESKNHGVHLIVKHNKKTVDFWPSTGKFISRCGKNGRGINNLIKFISAGEKC